MALKTVLDDCTIDKQLIDGDYQSSFLFGIAEEIKTALENRLGWAGSVSLLCAIEVAGREVLPFEKPGKKLNNTDTFNFFLANYMGYAELLKEQPRLYDDFRNGLIHEGFPKAPAEAAIHFGVGYNDENLGIMRSSFYKRAI